MLALQKVRIVRNLFQPLRKRRGVYEIFGRSCCIKTRKVTNPAVERAFASHATFIGALTIASTFFTSSLICSLVTGAPRFDNWNLHSRDGSNRQGLR